MILKKALPKLKLIVTHSNTTLETQIEAKFYLTLLEVLVIEKKLNEDTDLNGVSMGPAIHRLVTGVDDLSVFVEENNLINREDPRFLTLAKAKVAEAYRNAQSKGENEFLPSMLEVYNRLFCHPLPSASSEASTSPALTLRVETDNHSLTPTPVSMNSPISRGNTPPVASQSSTVPALNVGDVIFRLRGYYHYLKDYVKELPTSANGKQLIEDGSLNNHVRAMHFCRLYFHLVDELVDTDIITEADNISRLCFRTHLTTLLTTLSYIPLDSNIYYPIPSRRDFGWGTYAELTNEFLNPIRNADPAIHGQGVITAAETIYEFFLVNKPQPIELNPDRDKGYTRGPLVLDMYKYKKDKYKAVQTNAKAASSTAPQATPQLKNQ